MNGSNILNTKAIFFLDKMKIAELKANENVDEIILKIVEKKEARKVMKRYGGVAKLCELMGEDENGDKIKITLWNDEIDVIGVNDTIKIVDGWVKEWNGELQISTGKRGRIEKIE